MKVSEFLAKQKEEIPFFLYKGNNKGYKIPCIECQFFQKNKIGFWHCTSIFLRKCQDEFAEWCDSELEVK